MFWNRAGEFEGAEVRLEWKSQPPTPAALAPQGGGEQSEARAFPPWTGRKRSGVPAEGKVLQGLFFLKLKGRPRWGGPLAFAKFYG